MKLRKLSVVTTICLLVAGFFVTQAVADSYKVGAVFSVTGRTSFLGHPEKKTAELVVDQINKAGGINGKKLELLVYDTEGDATKTNLAVKKLITQDKVCAVIGPSLSGTSMAVVPLAEKYKIPLVSVAASYKITWDDKTIRIWQKRSR